MNRFSNYLASAKLVKLHLGAAEDAWKREHQDTFKLNILAAIREQQTAMNNLASMQFERKRAKKARS